MPLVVGSRRRRGKHGIATVTKVATVFGRPSLILVGVGQMSPSVSRRNLQELHPFADLFRAPLGREKLDDETRRKGRRQIRQILARGANDFLEPFQRFIEVVEVEKNQRLPTFERASLGAAWKVAKVSFVGVDHGSLTRRNEARCAPQLLPLLARVDVAPEGQVDPEDPLSCEN